MAEPAKWIKITTNMFEDDKIDMIQKMPEGDSLLVIWIRLLTMAGKSNSNGYILLQEDIAYDEDMLASKFNKSIQVVKLALAVFQKYKMIEITENGILITNFNKHQDLDKLNQKREQDRLRKQKQREKEKLLLSAAKEEIVAGGEMSRVTSRDNECDNTCEIERDSSTSTTLISISNSSSNNINSNNHAKNDDYISFFNNNFHMISPYEKEILQSYEEDGMSPDVIIMALIEAVEANARDIRYVKTILNRWLDNNIKTLDAVNANKEEFKRNKTTDKETKVVIHKKEDKFNNFDQRTYDYDALEKKLLGWDKD